MSGLLRRLAKWHIWLGWLVGVPLLMWTLSGLFMVSRPIDEVRGTHLRTEAEQAGLQVSRIGNVAVAPGTVQSATLMPDAGAPIWHLTYMDGSTARFTQDGARISEVTRAQALSIVADGVVGGDAVAAATQYEADAVPLDFRRPMAVWQVALEDGTHVYVGRDTGEIEAVRTRWWRIFDFMWGLHIMDLQERETISHPTLILFAALSAIGVLFGCILMFRHRKPRRKSGAVGRG
ncbi:MAG: PepSY domain-containing protein [Parerythrobacter sp.]